MEAIHFFNYVIWNRFLIYLFILLGLFLTIRLKGLQFRYFFTSLSLSFSRQEKGGRGDISPFQSLMTSLAATIGIGSITGMATAIMSGGFGAIFWMWVVSLLGLIIKYAEAPLAIKYRSVDHRGQMCGGPMQYIERGLGFKKLAFSFAFFGALSAFFGGNITQSHSIAHSLSDLFNIPPILTGVILMLFVAIVVLGGIKKVGKVNAILVPFMGVFYMLGALIILLFHYQELPKVFSKIFSDAFSLSSATRGVAIVGFLYALQMGIVRGICSNEAGLGSAPIAAAAAKTQSSVRQALICMTGVFLSSFVVCTLTVLVIGVTDVVGQTDATGSLLNGAPLVIRAYETVIPFGGLIVGAGILLFGYSTIIGWSYYGEKCVEYILGESVLKYYRFVFILFVFIGSLLSLELVWALVDLMNGLMALPNILALFLLTPVVAKESTRFSLLFENQRKKA